MSNPRNNEYLTFLPKEIREALQDSVDSQYETVTKEDLVIAADSGVVVTRLGYVVVVPQ